MTTRNHKRKPSLLEKVECILDFATDGCTMAPDLVFYDFCVEHDVYYATGEVNRTEADKILRKRIQEVGDNSIQRFGYWILGWVYWLGVRAYGWVPYYFGKNYSMRLEYQSHEHDHNI